MRPLQKLLFYILLLCVLHLECNHLWKAACNWGRKQTYLRYINLGQYLYWRRCCVFCAYRRKIETHEQHTSPFTSFIARPQGPRSTRSHWPRSFEFTIRRIENTECHLRVFIGWSDACCCFCQVIVHETMQCHPAKLVTLNCFSYYPPQG